MVRPDVALWIVFEPITQLWKKYRSGKCVRIKSHKKYDSIEWLPIGSIGAFCERKELFVFRILCIYSRQSLWYINAAYRSRHRLSYRNKSHLKKIGTYVAKNGINGSQRKLYSADRILIRMESNGDPFDAAQQWICWESLPWIMMSVIFYRSMSTCHLDKWENNDDSWHFKVEHRLRKTSSLFETEGCGQEEKEFIIIFPAV